MSRHAFIFYLLNTSKINVNKIYNSDLNRILHLVFSLQKRIQLSYKDSGVDIFAGDEMVQQIKPLAKSTHRPGVIGGLGGFGGLFRLNEVGLSSNNKNRNIFK